MSTFITIICIVAVIALFGINQRLYARITNLASRVARLEAGCSLSNCPLRESAES